jgi:hypothetical protein
MALSLPAYGHLGYIWDVEILDNMHLRGMGYEGFDCMEDKRNAHLSRNQEDKLVLLRTLQGVLYTTRDESLTNLLSKY